jgi:hypothetical protein
MSVACVASKAQKDPFCVNKLGCGRVPRIEYAWPVIGSTKADPIVYLSQRPPSNPKVTTEKHAV